MAYVLLSLVLIGVWLFALFDVLTTDEAGVRHLPKFGWFLVVLLGFAAGALLWLALGRVRGTAARGGPPAGPGSRAEAPKGPDDDPEFLRDLERRLQEDD
ncbi:PLDc N-terminal domain-containing protein [Spirillospora sp. NPDC029432]|uniref:PLDc N-terminal domain-containing protein n=1 Tax=Spirillospora sp. NPDC029432 TaxID=3154599 RepID=UPI0034514ABE